MKKNIEYLSFTALVLVGTLMTACSVKEEVLPEDPRPIPQDGLVMLSTTVGFEQSETRALTADGEKTFAAGDQIAVIYTNTSDNTVKAVSEVLTADKISAGGKSATFYVGVFNPKANSDVIYIYPASMAADDSGTPDLDALSVQDGKLESIARNLDYARFEGTLTAKAELPASATLENQLTICEFTLLDSIEDTDLSSSITELRIQEGFNAYPVNWTPAAGPIYVAMRPVTDNSITVTVQKSSVYYQKTFTNKTLSANRIYPITVMMPLQTMQEVPLTLEATQAGTNVTFSINAVASNPVSYRSFTSGAWSPWATYTSGMAISLAEVGDKVQFKGTNARYASSNVDFSHFTCSKNCKLYGNIMSLINASSFAQLTSLTGEYAFCLLFNNRKGDVNVLSDPDKPLLLPATTLTRSCYHLMFEKCSSLTAAPVLPAPTLVDNCYDMMFWGCKNLNSVTCLATDISANNCTFDWLSDVASTGTFTKAPGMTAWTTGANGIPSGWTAIGTDGQGALSNYETDNLNWY